MNLNELAKSAYENSKAKGWYDKPASKLERHMLIVSEIAEATEEIRNSKPDYYEVDGKPEGESAELADAVIRIADIFESNGWDLEKVVKAKMEYNKTRSYKHGGKVL